MSSDLYADPRAISSQPSNSALPTIRWRHNNKELVFQLLETLKVNQDLNQNVWPNSPGATFNSRKGCSEDLAAKLLSHHPSYSSAFALDNARARVHYGQSIRRKLQELHQHYILSWLDREVSLRQNILGLTERMVPEKTEDTVVHSGSGHENTDTSSDVAYEILFDECIWESPNDQIEERKSQRKEDSFNPAVSARGHVVHTSVMDASKFREEYSGVKGSMSDASDDGFAMATKLRADESKKNRPKTEMAAPMVTMLSKLISFGRDETDQHAVDRSILLGQIANLEHESEDAYKTNGELFEKGGASKRGWDDGGNGCDDEDRERKRRHIL